MQQHGRNATKYWNKDNVNRFYEITKQEVKQIEAELLHMDRFMETMERDHRVYIKVHEQKVQNLESLPISIPFQPNTC